MGNYQARIWSWIQAETSPNRADSPSSSILSILHDASQTEITSVVTCNIAITVLVLRHMLKVSKHTCETYIWRLT